MKTALTLVAGLFVATVAGRASADGAPPVKGKAPPASRPAQAKTVEPTKPFDVSKLGQRDAASDKEVARVNERCVSDPFSREGPSPEENARCTVAVARLVARGKKAAPSILAALDDRSDDASYYASNRLLFALGKIDDKKVRQAVADGFVTIAKEEMEDQTDIVYQIPEALEAMLGAAPEVAAPWKASSVTDAWEEHRQTAARWKTFVAANEGKSRKQIAQERLTQARKEKADADAEKAYRAISFLVSRSPAEALKAAKAYQKRDDLDDAVALEFEYLQTQAEMEIEEQQARAARAKAKAKS